MVNITRKLQTDEPYVLASQAEQVYYVSDIKEPNWHVVVKTKSRNFYDLPDDVVEDEPCQENENFGFTIQGSNLEDDNNVTVLHKPDLDATTVEVSSSNINTMSIEEDESDSDGDVFINDDDEIPTTEDEEVDDND
nr:transposon protein, putative, CACTA, En/Spm sub-class, expressed [Ipomoea batatas]